MACLPCKLCRLLQGLMTPVTVSKSSQWDCQNSYVKVPVRLLLCDSLTANAKLLWIALANQAGFRPISKSVLDLRLGVHRSTRSRLREELTDAGFIEGTARHIYLNDPVPVFDRLEAEDQESRVAAKQEMMREEGTVSVPEPVKQVKAKVSTGDLMAQAVAAWNTHRPANYQKINRLSSQLGKAIDLHLAALGLKSGEYERFFSVLKVGIERSQFWSNENSSKTLQSITGIGSPTTKKFNNVFSLYNDGLESEDTFDLQRKKPAKQKRIISASLRPIIDQYDEAQCAYVEAAEPSSPFKRQLESRTRFLVDTEELMRFSGLDPSEFRMLNSHVPWPTDTPPPSKARERFWIYTDEA